MIYAACLAPHVDTKTGAKKPLLIFSFTPKLSLSKHCRVIENSRVWASNRTSRLADNHTSDAKTATGTGRCRRQCTASGRNAEERVTYCSSGSSTNVRAVTEHLSPEEGSSLWGSRGRNKHATLRTANHANKHTELG